MSDPTGTSGLGAGSHVGADLAAVMQGGPTFIDRMEQLSARTAAHEKALNDLALGRGARDAYVHAHNLKADAVEAHAKAAQALTTANSQSTATLNEARATAARIVAKANADAEDLRKQAATERAIATADADRMTQEAARVLAEAAAKQAEVDAVFVAAMEEAKKFADATVAVEAERKDLGDRRDRLYLARDKLTAAIKEADGHVRGV
jgi:cell division septum initiation protein DivIVA